MLSLFSSRSSPRPALVGAEEGWILMSQWKTLMGHVRSWGRTTLGWKTVSTGGSGMTPPPTESCLLSFFISRFSLTLAWAPMCLNCFSFSHPLTYPVLWTFGPIFFCQGNLPPTPPHTHIFYWQTFPLLSGHKWDMALPSRTPSPWDKAPFFPIPPLLTPLCWLLSPLFQAARAAAVSSPGTPALSLGTGGLSIWWLNLKTPRLQVNNFPSLKCVHLLLFSPWTQNLVANKLQVFEGRIRTPAWFK